MNTSYRPGDLERFDTEFAPSPGRCADLSILTPDADYDFEIMSAVFDRTKDGDTVLRWTIRVSSAGPHRGQMCSHTYWFKSQDNVNILGTDLCTLGFDADAWKPPARPFSQEIAKVLPKLAGIRFRGRVKKNDKYTNLYLNARLSESSPPPPPSYNPQAQDHSGDIPF